MIGIPEAVLLGRPGLPVPADASVRLCLAQAQLMAFELRTDVGIAECPAMAEDNAAALFPGVCAIRTMAGGDVPVCRLAGELGR